MTQKAELEQLAEIHDGFEMRRVIERLPDHIEIALNEEMPELPRGQFDRVVLFGLGGLVAEIVDDVILTSTPVTPQRAMALLQTLKLWPLLDGARGRPQLDADAVCDMISRLSWLAHDLRDSLLELDLNPVMVKRRGEGAVAVDARASLRLNH